MIFFKSFTASYENLKPCRSTCFCYGNTATIFIFVTAHKIGRRDLLELLNKGSHPHSEKFIRCEYFFFCLQANFWRIFFNCLSLPRYAWSNPDTEETVACLVVFNIDHAVGGNWWPAFFKITNNLSNALCLMLNLLAEANQFSVETLSLLHSVTDCDDWRQTAKLI